MCFWFGGGREQEMAPAHGLARLALHTYLCIGDITGVRVEGLDGVQYLDRAPGAGSDLVPQLGPGLLLENDLVDHRRDGSPHHHGGQRWLRQHRHSSSAKSGMAAALSIHGFQTIVLTWCGLYPGSR